MPRNDRVYLIYRWASAMPFPEAGMPTHRVHRESFECVPEAEAIWAEEMLACVKNRLLRHDVRAGRIVFLFDYRV